MTVTHSVAPSVADELRRLTRSELSTGSRVSYVLLALVASAMSVVVASLWLTEPALPFRTHIAFALLLAIGCGWTAFSTWALSTRTVMLATHRVVAGRLAVTFTSVFTAGCAALALASGLRAAWTAFAMATTLLVIAMVMWRRAETARAELVARRRRLEQQIEQSR